jgi:ATP-dependent DNA helicase UvrD/PcrA
MMDALGRAIEELQTNKRQWQAFQSRVPTVVLAPPGSGKTKLLATRMAYDLVTHIPKPAGAACITLTNAAAGELGDRLALIVPERRGSSFVGTVHSFALTRVVLPFAKAAGLVEEASLSIADDAQRRAALQAAVAATYRRDEDTRFVESTFRRYRNSVHAKLGSGPPARIASLVSRYEEQLRSQKLLDFDDLINLASEIVETHAFVRRTLAARYPFLYIDECQDLAPALHRLLEAMCFDSNHRSSLFAVGDPDQSIFGFTGSKPDLLVKLSRRDGVVPITLNINYRSSAEVIRVAKKLLVERTDMVGLRSGGSVTAERIPSGYDGQIDRAASLVKQAVQRGTPLHEIAVLCGTNAEATDIASRFQTARIPTFLRSAAYPHTAGTRFLELCAAWCTSRRASPSLGDVLRQWRALTGHGAHGKTDISLLKALRQYKGLDEHPAHELIDAVLGAGLTAALHYKARSEDLIAVQAASSTARLRYREGWLSGSSPRRR